MANIKKIDNKDGLSYKITVSSGRDAEGKQIRHYMTYVPPKTWSEQRASKEASKQAALFEESVEKGYNLDNRQTFAEYTKYVLDLKLRQGSMKESTYELYELLLTRINPAIGHMKLADIRPAHLNNLYESLLKEGTRSQAAKAIPKADISELIKSKNLTREKVSKLCEISHNTVTEVCRGKTIHASIAEKIAKLLGVEVDMLFKIEKKTSPLSAKTVLEHHRLISSVLAQAEKEMLIPYNAASKAVPPHPKRPEPNYFQPETMHKILEAADNEPLKYRVFTNLLVVTGCRRGEIAGLIWNKIDFNTGKIIIDCGLYYSVKRGVYEGTTKTNERRSLKIPMEVVALLRQLRRDQSADRISNGDRWTETGYVFTQDNGMPMNPDSFNTWMIKFSKCYGLPHINPHAFRHTMASVLISNGVDVVTTSKMLGHASVTTTESFYAHVIEDAKDAATETVATVLLKRKA